MFLAQMQHTLEKSKEEFYEIFKDKLTEAADESFSNTGKGKKREVPWWSQELQELLKEKHRISNLMIKTRKKLNRIIESNPHNHDQMTKIIQLSTELKVIRPMLNQLSALFKRKVTISRKES